MPSSPQQPVNDEILKSYLFGDLPADEIERLDEWSIVDDDFAARLDNVETDLVDAYVRGELSGDTLENFRTRYLASPARRQRVAFAESLSSVADNYRPQLAPAKPSRSWLSWFTIPRLALAGGLAMAIAVGFVGFDHLHPRENPDHAAADHAVVTQPEPAPQAPPATPSTAEKVISHLPAVSITTFVLAPQMRGATQMPTLSLPHGTTRVDLHLDLEANDFPRYRVTLKSLRKDKPLWQNGDVAAVTKGESKSLSISLPAKLFKPAMYQLDLTGMPSSGEAELVGSYVFRIVKP